MYSLSVIVLMHIFVDIGISSFENDPDKAGEMIKKCIDGVALKFLPHKDVKKTAIYVGATAGMRLLWYGCYLCLQLFIQKY